MITGWVFAKPAANLNAVSVSAHAYRTRIHLEMSRTGVFSLKAQAV